MPSSPAALFRLRDFRCLSASMLVNSAGMMAENVVLGWLVLELTDSPLMVGVAMGTRALPLFLAGVPAGALADRFSRQRLVMATGAGQALTAGALGALALPGHATLGRVLALTFLAGVVRAVEHAARQSYTHDVVGAPALVNGFAVLGVAMRAGWLAGALGAGAILARWGAGAGYLAVAAGFLGGALALLPASTPPAAAGADAPSVWRGVVTFLAAMRTDRALTALMVLTAGAEILGFSHQVLLPSLARDVLHAGPEGLGVLSAARAVGGILGLLLASLHGPLQGNGALFLAVLVTFGATLVGLGAAPYVMGFLGVVLVLTTVNAVGALADLFAQTLLQLSVPRHLRGRAGGAWVVAIGLAPLGQLQIGALASLFGVSLAFGASGLALTALAGGIALLAPRVRRL
ncbi:MAG TPA: MFS transporter [Methylomirabilota bacterium]|nr:MFS transporter [Methylomirabilota bacterium]